MPSQRAPLTAPAIADLRALVTLRIAGGTQRTPAEVAELLEGPSLPVSEFSGVVRLSPPPNGAAEANTEGSRRWPFACAEEV